jgi:hypothetical protein
MIDLQQLWMKIKPLVVGLISPGWTTYTPTLTASTTNPTLGSGSTATGRYTVRGDTVEAECYLAFGSGMNAGSGIYLVSLPVTANYFTGYQKVGYGFCYDSSAFVNYLFVAQINSTDATKVMFAYQGGDVVKNNLPFAWAQSDHITFVLSYRI